MELFFSASLFPVLSSEQTPPVLLDLNSEVVGKIGGDWRVCIVKMCCNSCKMFLLLFFLIF